MRILTHNELTAERESAVYSTGAEARIEASNSGEWLLLPYGSARFKGLTQVFGKPQAEAMARAFNSLLGKFQRCFKPAPVFIGHPDVDPARWTDKVAIGQIEEVQALEDAMAVRIAWNAAGTAWKQSKRDRFPSPVWWCDRAGQQLFPAVLSSIGMTDTPNFSDMPAWNSRSAADQTQDETMIKQLLSKLGLSETASPDEVDARIQALNDASAALDTARAELAQQRQATEAAATMAASQVQAANEATATATAATTAAATAAAETAGQLQAANARNAALTEALAGQVIARGAATEAARADVIQAINAADAAGIQAAVQAIQPRQQAANAATPLDLKRVKAANAATAKGRVDAIQAKVAEFEKKGLNYESAYNAALTAHPELFATE